MAVFSAASLAAPMVVTGNVSAAREFLTVEQRAALPAGAEAPPVLSADGVPLMDVEVLTTEEIFGEVRTVPQRVRVPRSPDLERLAPLTAVKFVDLEASVYVSQPKGGGGRAQLRVAYRAAGVEVPGAPRRGGE